MITAVAARPAQPAAPDAGISRDVPAYRAYERGAPRRCRGPAKPERG